MYPKVITIHLLINQIIYRFYIKMSAHSENVSKSSES